MNHEQSESLKRQPMHKFQELKIWQKSMVLTKNIYELTGKFPVDEKYGLISQMRRASVSIASNIAEGAGRNNDKEFVHFLGVANGSSYELTTQLILAQELDLVPDHNVQYLLESLEELQKMTYKMISVYQKKSN